MKSENNIQASWPEHCKCTPYVDLEVGHEEAVREGVRQLVCIKVGMDETKEDIVGFPAFVGQEADDTGEVDASQQSHQNESLDKTHSQMLGKFEYTGGPIFKVVLEC